MDTIFIWIIAGAAIGLLGIFLVASERELKRKRQELQELKNQLTDLPAAGISNPSTDVHPEGNFASAELIARNEELLQEVSSLSKKLETSESKLEQLETLRAHLNSKESEITELRWERERLQSELATLKTPSASNDFHPDEATRHSQTDAEIAALKEQLEASQAKLRELESAQMQPAVPESGQKAFEELQRSLEVSTLQVQNALAAEQEKQKALEATQGQLSDLQRRHHELSEANLRLREENSQQQQKLTNQSQLQVERLVILRQRFEQLRSKQAEAGERDRLIQEEIVSMSQLLLDVIPEYSHSQQQPSEIRHDHNNILEFRAKEPADTAHHAEIVEQTPFGARAPELHNIQDDAFDKTNGISAEPYYHHSANLTAVVGGAPATDELSTPELKKKKRRFGIFPAAIGVFVVSGVLAAGFLGKDPEQDPSVQQAKSEATPNPSGLTAGANVKSQPRPALQENKDGPSEDKIESRIAKTSDKPMTAIASSARSSSTAWESYEIVQATRVFSAPSEHSQLVANIDPGTQVNVVDSRNGWLEIRSKHGRPPGFIRQASAIRIGQN